MERERETEIPRVKEIVSEITADLAKPSVRTAKTKSEGQVQVKAKDGLC